MINLAEKIEIKDHILVPKFSKLTEEEAKELLDKLNISSLQLPFILAKDPMAKEVKAVPGDIIKIERKHPTGEGLFYRRVV